MTLFETLNKLESSILLSGSKVKPASEREIKNLEKESSVTLPRVYKNLLAKIGNGSGKFFQDSDFLIYQVKYLKHEVIEMFEEDSRSIQLPEKAFFFLGYQGYQYHFFICDNNNNPPVFRICDDGKAPLKVAESLMAFIERAVDEYIQAESLAT